MSSNMMLDMLRRDWRYAQRRGLYITDCQPIRVYPRDAAGFLLEYEVRFKTDEGERVQQVFGELVGARAELRRQELIDSLRKSRRGQKLKKDRTDLIDCFPSLGLVLRFPGLDEKLFGLKLVHQSETTRSILSQYTDPGRVQVEGIATEILGHRLGKRCVVRFRYHALDPETGEKMPGSIIAKIYDVHSDRARCVAAAMKYLSENGFAVGSDIRIPQLVAYLPDLRVLLMEDVPGVPLPGLAGADLATGVTAAGRALAKLHQSPPEVAACYTVDDEIALLEGWVGLVSEVHPHLRTATTDALEIVREALDRCREFTPTLVHRDFYEKQALIAGPCTILIDFDTLCRSDPALDVGNFLAHLQLARLQGFADLAAAEDAFLGGYGDALSTDMPRRVVAYTKSALLRLVCLYSFHRRWRHVTDPLLDALNGL